MYKVKGRNADFETSVSLRTADSPRVLTQSECVWPASMERIIEDSGRQGQLPEFLHAYMVQEKTLEASPKHSILNELETWNLADRSAKAG